MTKALAHLNRVALAFVALAIHCGLLTPVSALAQQTAATQNFDVPAGEARPALRQFATQAKRELVFEVSDVKGINTHAVKGEMTAGEALNQMLLDTGLVASRDAKTGAFAVRKETHQESKNALRVARTDSDHPDQSKVAGDKAANLAETLTLSPFVVTGEKDTGYQATDTLAGTRLRTSLKDIAASISVVTKDMLEDTGSHNLLDVLVYTGGTEVAGISGNYSATTMTVGNNTGVSYSTQRTEINPVSRVRGLAGADLTRNYFASRIPLDSYNTQSITINRGSNNILFGLGSPAGIIENTTVLPEFRNHTKLQLGTDSYGSTRESIDLERVLVKDKLSLRVTGLVEATNYEQEPAYRDQERLYGAIEYRPFKNTTLRVNAEKGSLDQNRPRLDPPQDALGQWYANGKPVFLGDHKMPPWNGVNLDFTKGPPRWLELFQNGLTGGWDFYGTPGVSWSNPGQATYTDSFPTIIDDASADIPVANRAGWRWLGPWDATSWRSIQGNNVARFQVIPQITDRSIFDYRKHAIDGPNSGVNMDFEALNASVEQLFLDGNAGIELVVDKQRTKTDRFSLMNQGNLTIRVDVNETTIDGRPNPNFGRPAISSAAGSFGVDEVATLNARATAFFKHDFRKYQNSLVRLLGEHTLTGSYNDSLSKQYAITGTMNALDPTYKGPLINNNVIGNRTLGNLVYIGPSLLNTTSPAGLNLASVSTKLTFPDQITTWVLEQPAPGQNRVWKQSTHKVYRYPDDLPALATAVSANRQEVLSTTGVWQGKWANGMLVSTLGWRHDELEQFAGTGTAIDPVTGARLLNAPHLNSSLAAKSSQFSQGYALHMPRSWQKRMPLGLDASLYYNKSENFQLSTLRRTIYGKDIDPQTGTTDEIGLGMSAFEGKLTFRVTKYKSVQDNLSDSRLPSGTLNNVYGVDGRAYNNLTAAQLQAGGWVNFDDPQASPLYKAYAAAYGYKLTGPDPITGKYTFTITGAPIGVAETTSAVSEGYEFEMTYNPTKNWRIAVNVTQSEAVRGDAGRDFGPLVADRMAIYSKPGLKDLTVDGQAFLIYPTILLDTPTKKAQYSTGQKVQELVEWRANLMTNYSFARESRLKGWGIGGAVRWQDQAAIGYAPLVDPVLGNLDDLANPFMGPTQTAFDGWLSYRRLIWRNKIDWKVQLNVHNIMNENLLIPVRANPVSDTDKKNFTIGAWRIGEERNWQITSTFSF